MSGWIKIYRCLLDDEMWQDPEPYDKRSAWLDLLLRAAYEDHEERTSSGMVLIRRGELLTSEAELAARWRWSRGKVRRFLAANKAAHRTAMRRAGNGTKDGTILTVENYTKYQGTRPRDETKGGTKDGTRGGTKDGTSKIDSLYINNNIKESLRIVKEGKEERLAEMRERIRNAQRRRANE